MTSRKFGLFSTSSSFALLFSIKYNDTKFPIPIPKGRDEWTPFQSANYSMENLKWNGWFFT